MVYATPCEVAQQSDVVIICVTGAPQVEEVVAAERGLLEGLRHGAGTCLMRPLPAKS